jgi:hypothetical protein
MMLERARTEKYSAATRKSRERAAITAGSARNATD